MIKLKKNRSQKPSPGSLLTEYRDSEKISLASKIGKSNNGTAIAGDCLQESRKAPHIPGKKLCLDLIIKKIW